jgi:FAD/FMN-containing dehydrogenase
MAPVGTEFDAGPSSPRRPLWKRRAALLSAALIALPVAYLARPGWHLWRTAKHDVDAVEPIRPGFVSDASRMGSTHVKEVWHAPANLADAEAQLSKLLRDVRENSLKVAIAGARHTMGGHTTFPDGVVLDMLPLAHLELDEDSNQLRVGAGAMWRDVLGYLDARGRSISIMQSNSSFTVGGSVSVNCHGWQVGRPPIASTVQSIRMMLADGSVVQCNREQHHELFSAALGGYGLMGVILEIELKVVPNRRYSLFRSIVPTNRLEQEWKSVVASHPGTEMVYARLNVTQERFLKDSILYAWHEDSAAGASIPSLRESNMVELRRQVFRGSAESEYGKQLRWDAEVNWQPKLGGNVNSRNQLLYEGVEIFQNRSADTTDILHEYFVPRGSLSTFVDKMGQIIQRHNGNLLNVTVRSVDQDLDTLLCYARQPVVSTVLLFHQRRDSAADEKMSAMTRELIDAALDVGGSYYLPYRPHASIDQFRRAYPRSQEFFALKKRWDPDEVFQNQFYLNYGPNAQSGNKDDHN